MKRKVSCKLDLTGCDISKTWVSFSISQQAVHDAIEQMFQNIALNSRLLSIAPQSKQKRKRGIA